MKERTLTLPTTTGPELEMLGALWAPETGGEASPEPELNQKPLKLSQVCDRIEKRRERFGEPLPAVTTVSSTLRKTGARLRKRVDIQTIVDAIRPNAIAPQPFQKPAPGVIAARPVITPLTEPVSDGLSSKMKSPLTPGVQPTAGPEVRV